MGMRYLIHTIVRIQMTFYERLRAVQVHTQSVLCVGLDPDPVRMPQHLLLGASHADAVMRFNEAIIRATAPYACAYKLNFAFFETLGRRGYDVLDYTRSLIPSSTLVVADAKRGDIGNSASKYAKAVFELLDFDACTVAPYMGRDAVAPFLAYENKAAFILVRTSNPSGQEFQAQIIDGRPLYEFVAERAVRWEHNLPGTIGFVVGATHRDEPARLRTRFPRTPFLMPGVGAQGGSLEDAAMAANAEGGVLVSSSRSILYASDGEDFAVRAAEAARALSKNLKEALQPGTLC